MVFFAQINFIVVLLISAGTLIPGSDGLQCHCYTNELSEEHMLDRGCLRFGDQFIRTCKPGMICVKAKGLVNNQKEVHFQGCADIPPNVKLGTCPPFIMNQNGHVTVGNDCYCDSDLCNPASKLRGLTFTQLGACFIILSTLSYYLGGGQ